MIDFMEHGPLMDEAGGADAGGGTAVADASSDFGGGGSTDTSVAESGTDGEVHDAEFVDPAASQEIAPRGTSLQVKAGEPAVQNGRFTGSGRAAIENLKTLSPKLAQEVTQALLTRDYFRQQFPGGKKEVVQLRQLAEKNGGEQGISELQRTVSFFNTLDELFSESNPKFFDQITITDNEKAAFVGLMPAAFDKFEQLGREHFGYEMAKRFTHLMDSARLPVTFGLVTGWLDRAAAAQKAGNNELAASFISEITASYNSIVDTLNKVYTAASNPPAAPGTAADPKLNDRERQLSEREKGLQKSEWESSVQNERRRIFSKAWAEVTKGRSLTSDQDTTVKGFYELRMTAKIKQWQNQAARFLANGDRDGYLREQYGFFQKAIPEALRQAIQQALPAKPGPKTTTTAPKQTPGGPLRPPTAGAVRVAKMPPTSDLDPIKTTGAMLSENRAYTKDGRLVQWA